MAPKSEKQFPEVQERLANLLGMDAVPADIWQELLDHHLDLIVHAHKGGEEEWEDLVRQAQSLYRVWSRSVGRMPPLGRGQKKEMLASHLSPLELERTAVFEEHLAKVVATDPEVRRFRVEVLDGRLLTPDEARVLLGSEAARFLRHAMFTKLGIPVLGHTSTLDDYRREDVRVEDSGTDLVRHLATVSIEPPGITETVRTTLWPDPFVDLTFPTEDGYIDDRPVWRSSLLGWLQELSETLAETYRWFPSQVSWFLLTGKVPAAPPVRMRYWWNASPYHREGVIDMEVALWVSADTVRDAIYALQRRALKGHDNRALGEKNLKLLRFVTERMDETDLLGQDRSNEGSDRRALAASLEQVKLPQGSELVAEWDSQDWVQQKQHQENKKGHKKKKQRWVYNGDTRRFWRDLRRAQKAVMVPTYEWPDKL